jgi:hypothetical protein
VISILHQPETEHFRCRRAFDNGLHQLAPDPLVLHRRLDRNRADAANYRSLVKKIAAEDASVAPGHHAVEAGMGD